MADILVFALAFFISSVSARRHTHSSSSSSSSVCHNSSGAVVTCPISKTAIIIISVVVGVLVIGVPLSLFLYSRWKARRSRSAAYRGVNTENEWLEGKAPAVDRGIVYDM